MRTAIDLDLAVATGHDEKRSGLTSQSAPLLVKLVVFTNFSRCSRELPHTHMASPIEKKRPASQALYARRQEQILGVAVQLFAEQGYSNADTQQLAERLGVGKGTLYRYFDCKRELFLAAVDRVMRQLLATVLDAMAPVTDPLESLRMGIVAFLEFFAANPAFVELLIQERALFKDRPKPTFQEHREANRERWRPLYQSLIDAGRMRKIPTDRCMNVVGNQLYGAIFTNYVAGQTIDAADQARDLIDVLFLGLLSDSERKAQNESSRPVGVQAESSTHA